MAIGESLLRRKRGGDREEKSASASRCAFDPDASAVSLDDPFGDGKSEPGAETPGTGCLPESIKDTRQVLRRDTRARIRHSEDDLVVPRGRTHRDTTASLRELDRVADQVLEHLEESIPITPNIGKIAVQFDSKLERRGSGEWSLHIHRPDDQVTCSQLRWFDGQLPRLHDRDIQKILNQAVHALGGAFDHLRWLH